MLSEDISKLAHSLDQSVEALSSNKNSVELLMKVIESIKKDRDDLKEIIENSYDALVVSDAKGKLQYVSRSYKRITGYDPVELIGKSMHELEKIKFVNQSVSLLVLKTGKPMTIRQILPNDSEIFLTGNPVFDNEGNIVKVVTNVRNIEELNYLDRQLKAEIKKSKRYETELEHYRRQQLISQNMVVHSKEMEFVINMVNKVSKVDSTVLITGESGVGKEMVARMIHSLSARKKEPFITVNCGAIPENLLESELFGYEKGSFTGANKEGKMGLLEVAENGTIFLDEIAEIPLNLQVKLLRALQECEILRIGGKKPIKLNVRFLAATNKNLEEMVEEKIFRKDLYYRLNVIPINVPPLRQRSPDIIPLAYHFLHKFNKKYGKAHKFNDEACRLLENYMWPGNARELENLIERLVVISDEQIICSRHLKQYLGEKIQLEGIKSMPIKGTREMLEINLINEALSNFKSIRQAARFLGISHSTLIKKIQKYKIKSGPSA